MASSDLNACLSKTHCFVPLALREDIMSVAHAVRRELPGLRRFARALCGSQKSGDAYVTEALEAVLANPTLVGESYAKFDLHRLLLSLWGSVDVNVALSSPEGIRALSSADRNLQAISPRARAAFLLTALEGFSVEEAATAMGTSEETLQRLLEDAEREIAEQTAGTVLIIEDEPLIAMHVSDIARSMGHTVLSIARTHAEAVAAAREHRPDLVLADICLADGSSGLEAVQEILRSIEVPIAFITAYPERLLTGERPEPTYLIEKPFRAAALKAMISQVTFFQRPRPSANQEPRPSADQAAAQQPLRNLTRAAAIDGT
jgi:DNA-directed RNA polymerase specialized sigma24 family protein/CheY-like chemotaxis protein